MKPEKIYLSELTPNSKDYKVKVKVIDKAKAQKSPTKNINYQRLMFADEKGNKMRGALFGDQIANFKNAIAYNGEYEIANATIKPQEEKWRTSPQEASFQMTFNTQTIIHPIGGPVIPAYQQISSIPKFAGPEERFDIFAVILYVEEAPGRQVTVNGRPNMVREIFAMDQSSEQPLLISAWNAFAEEECAELADKYQLLPVIGMTALKISNHKGFSLSTTMSTTISEEPQGPLAKQVQEWAMSNRSLLANTQARIMQIRDINSGKEVLTIAGLQAFKIGDIIQDEEHSLQVTIPGTEFTELHAYVGCSQCGKTTTTPLGKQFACTLCHNRACTSSPRVNFKCNLYDNTGTLPVTLFTDNCEKVFGMSAADIFRMRLDEDEVAFAGVQRRLEENTIVVRVTPSTALTRNRSCNGCSAILP